MLARDTQFVETAVASGVLDPSRARRIVELRASAPTGGEPIEHWAVRVGLARPDEIERIVAFAMARGRGGPQAAAARAEAPHLPAVSQASVTFDPVLEERRRAALEAASRTEMEEFPATPGPESPGAATFSEASPPPSLPPLPANLGAATFSEASLPPDSSATLGGAPANSFSDVPAASLAVEQSFAAPGLDGIGSAFGATPSGSVASAADATFWSEDGNAPVLAGVVVTPRAPLGKRLGPYEILGEIARGGMGVVYRARREGEERIVALKLLLDESNPSDVIVRRFKREIRAGMEIDHPGVVKVFDSGTIEGRLYFTMEFIDGTALQNVILTLDLPARIAILEQVSRAVHAAHEKGYVHRDLKPHNVLVSRNLVPKVADFGLAKSLDRQSRLTKTGAVLGTILYMSPEQATGGGEGLDKTTDVYSLGVMLYQALCGHVPFREGATHEMLKQILERDPPDPRAEDPTIPADLVAVSMRALEKDPTKRFPTALIFADELRAWLDGHKLKTAPATAVSKGARWARRHKAPVAAVVGLLVIGGVATGVWRGLLRERAVRAKIEAEKRELVEAAAAADRILAKVAEPGPTTTSFKDELGVVAGTIEHFRAVGTSAANAEARAELETRRYAVEGALAVANGDEIRDGAPGELELELKLARAFERAPERLDVRVAHATALDVAGRIEDERAVLAPVAEKSAALLERLGACDLELDSPALAARSFRQALALEPGRASARVSLARALVASGHPEQALELLEASDGARKRELDERIVLDEALASRDPGAALTDLRRLERTNDSDAELLRRTAGLALALGRADESLASFTLAAAKAPRDPRPLVGRAEAFALSGDVSEACQELERAAALARAGSLRRARIRAREIRLRTYQNDTPGAERVAREALAEKPSDLDLELAVALGAALRGEGGARAALEAVAAVASAPPGPEPALAERRVRGRARLALARLDLAGPSKAFAGEALLAADAGNDDEALAVVARCREAAGGEGAEAARHAAHVAFVGSGTSDGARFFRGSMVAAGLAERFASPVDVTRAEALLHLAEAAAPWAGEPVVERARRRLAAGEKAGVVRPGLERGLALVGDEPDSLALLARCLLDEDEAANATRGAELAERALARQPQHAPALALRARANLARGQVADAVRDIEASLKVAHTDAAVWALARRIHEKKGDAAAVARDEIEIRDRTSPRRGEIVAAALDRHVDDWHRALDLEPDHPFGNYRAISSIIYQLANGNVVSSEDPWPFLGRAVASTPAILNDCAGAALKSAQNFGVADTAVRYEENVDDLASLRTASCLRVIAIAEAIVDKKVVSKDMIDIARLDIERQLALAPGEVSAQCLQGLLFALERRPALAAALCERGNRYFDNAGICYYAWGLAEATRGDKAKARALVARLLQLDEDLHQRAMETPEFQALDK